MERSELREFIDGLPSAKLDVQRQHAELISLLEKADKKRLVEEIAIGSILRTNLSQGPILNHHFGVRPRGVEYLFGLLSTLDFEQGHDSTIGYQEIGLQFARFRDALLLSKAGIFAADESISTSQYRAELGVVQRELDTGRFVYYDQIPRLARVSYEGFEGELEGEFGFNIDDALAASSRVDQHLVEAGAELGEELQRGLVVHGLDVLRERPEKVTLAGGIRLLSEDETFEKGLELITRLHEHVRDSIDSLWTTRSSLLRNLPADLSRESMQWFIDAFSLTPGSKDSLCRRFRFISQPNPVEERPILEVKGRFFVTSNELLRRSIAERFYYTLRESMDTDTFDRRWGANAEEYVRSTLLHVVPEDQLLVNGSYRTRGKAGETDFVVLGETDLLVVECKTKKLTVKSRSGEASSIRSDLEPGLGKAHSQAKKFIRELLREGEVKLTVDGTIHTIKKADYERVHPIVVTRDSYDNIATADFSGILDLEGSFPFVTDFYNLETICRTVSGPSELVEYVSLRRRELRDQHVYSADEVDYLGEFLTKGTFSKGDEQGVRQLDNYTDEVRARAGFRGIVESGSASKR